ncbi:MAG: MoaD/ThiS family protein, partial [Gammaproteobacteria bacterium]
NVLIAVNMEYTDGSRVLKNGDEVAFFPPVTGG